MISRQDIKAFRIALGWSRRKFADAIPVDPRTVRRWETEFTSPRPVAERRIHELMKEHKQGAA